MSTISASGRVRRAWLSFLLTLAVFVVALGDGDLFAQKAHYLFNTRQPVGEIGRIQLARRPELRGVAQPVLLRVPKGAEISVAEGAGFPAAEADAALVSLQVGKTYRLKVSNVPNRYGDVYPTVELLGRMHAPVGKETRFPIPVELTTEDLGLAMSGKYVTRVIFVEDPQRALPGRDLPQQRYLDAMPHEDPLHVASSIGRPVAILRMGSLTPGSHGPSTGFLFGSPPFQRHAAMPAAPYTPSELKAGDLPTKPLPGEESTTAPPALDEGPEETLPDTTEAEALDDPQAEQSPNDQLDGVVEPLEPSDTDLNDAGDIFDEPITEDELGDEDPFADDI